MKPLDELNLPPELVPYDLIQLKAKSSRSVLPVIINQELMCTTVIGNYPLTSWPSCSVVQYCPTVVSNAWWVRMKQLGRYSHEWSRWQRRRSSGNARPSVAFGKARWVSLPLLGLGWGPDRRQLGAEALGDFYSNLETLNALLPVNQMRNFKLNRLFFRVRGYIFLNRLLHNW